MPNDIDLKMPELETDKRVVLAHLHGPMKGVHSICGLTSKANKPLPEFLDAVDLIDAPTMRTPGPVSLVASKPRYVLYKQVTTPEMQNGKSFNRSQR